jgi:NAD(P)H-flavin reductase
MTVSTTTRDGRARVEPMLPNPYRVVGRERETPDTVTVTFEPVRGGDFGFRPGQFSMLYVYGVGEVALSISGHPGPPGRLQHTVRSVGPVTAAICSLDLGDTVGARGPYGQGWPLEEAEGRSLVIAGGGIGLAPLRPVMLHALENRERFVDVSLIYGTRSPADLLYEREVRQWRSRFDVEVEVTVDRAAPGWHGDVGVVTTLLDRIPVDPKNTVAMVCGPEIMMKVTARELEARGVSRSDIYVSLERNMKCAVGFCGHCQFGGDFICKDGPVVPYERVIHRMRVPEL